MVFLAAIYAAREQNTLGISSKDLSDVIPNARFFNRFEEIVQAVRQTARKGDLILTIGAGDIYKVGEALVALED